MCGPLLVNQSRKGLNRFLKVRLFTYTFLGALLGKIGNILSNSLEMKVIGVLSFMIFVLVSILVISPEFFPAALRRDLKGRLLSYKIPASLHGGLLALLPCHLLLFNYGLAVLSGSALGGGLLLFGHAVITTPALSYTRHFWNKIERHSPKAKIFMKASLAVLVLITLTRYANAIFQAEANTQAMAPICQ